jgi:hypothetical protein
LLVLSLPPFTTFESTFTVGALVVVGVVVVALVLSVGSGNADVVAVDRS